MSRVLHLDGATLEGGGQLVRNAVAFAALLHRPVHIYNIRAGRKQPGLKAQHVAGINLLRCVTSPSPARNDENSIETTVEASRIPQIGDTSLYFSPREIVTGNFEGSSGTAGATSLMLQTILPCLLFPNNQARLPHTTPLTSFPEDLTQLVSSVSLHGGTNATQAPPIDYTQHVLLPFLQTHFNISLPLSLLKRGFYPVGGGHIHVSIPAIPPATSLSPVTLVDRGSLLSIHGVAYVSALPLKIATLMRDAAIETLKRSMSSQSIPIEIKIEHESAPNARPGSGIILWANTDTNCVLGSSSLGQKRIQAQNVGIQAAQELLRNLAHGGCVDEYLQAS